MHTDYVHDQLKNVYATGMQKYKASAISGFFLQHNTVEGKPVYPEEMKNIFQLVSRIHTHAHAYRRTHMPTLASLRCAELSVPERSHQQFSPSIIFPMMQANSTHGLNDACIAAQKPGEEWQCNFAQHAYAHTSSDTFPLNSALDSWQARGLV